VQLLKEVQSKHRFQADGIFLVQNQKTLVSMKIKLLQNSIIVLEQLTIKQLTDIEEIRKRRKVIDSYKGDTITAEQINKQFSQKSTRLLVDLLDTESKIYDIEQSL